jgi:serine/threonine protein kinase
MVKCASYTDPKYLGLLMLPVADCNLSDYYDIVHDSVEKLTVLRTFFGCLTEALRYLHECRIRHKDIKPKNILVKGDQVFFTDIGLAIDWQDSTAFTTTGPYSVTREYTAPEVLAGASNSTSTDIWSLGCVFIEMFSVLKGSTVDALRCFLGPQPGVDNSEPQPDRPREWLDTLRAQGDSRDNCIIKWVSAMFEHRPELRPTATMLHDDIAKESEDQDLAFCGLCCMPESDPSEEEHESDGEDRANNEEDGVDDDLWN